MAFRRRVTGLSIACALIAAGHCAAAERINLAGAFNGWNTNDSAFEMKHGPDGRYALERDWHSGQYEFKFVFDGSWARHLGQSAGTLAQPGDNIKLRVAQSGRYRLWLDVSGAKWGFERKPAETPIAVFRVNGADSGAAAVALDARDSVARPGKPISTYRWSVAHDGQSANLAVVQTDPSEPVALLTAPHAGDYDITLTVDDGEKSHSHAARARLGFGWLLRDSESRVVRLLTPLDSDRWACVYPVNADATVTLHVEPAVAARSDSGKPITLEAKLAGQKAYLVRFDPRTSQIDLLDSGWHEFALDPAKLSRRPDMPIESVAVAGTFNDWNGAALPLFADASRERWTRCVELPDGLHHYKFLLNGCDWVADPAASSKLADADGNSGLRIGDDPASFGAAKSDAITAAAVRHDPSRPGYAACIDDDLHELSLRTLADDVQSVTLEWPADKQRHALSRSRGRDGFDWWTARVAGPLTDRPYEFVLRDGSAEQRVQAGGKQPMSHKHSHDFDTPDWAKRAVWYQIFPERFRNGDPSNDPPTAVPWKHAWFKNYDPQQPDDSAAYKSGYREKGPFYHNIYNRRYGGDLQGVRQALPYLRDLGVTAIYFNPIFLAESLHKYDASDYRHIDDFFAVKDSLSRVTGETDDPTTWQWSDSDKYFLDFMAEAHRMGFRIVLDGVFNHVGRDFWAFKDVLKNGKNSPYAGWFDITSWEPFHYKAWDKDDGALPRLKHDDALGLTKVVRDHLFAVTRRWMDPNGDGDPSDGIDGWRLDVAQDINEHFWRDWRKLVKSVNPQAIIIAEIWTEARSALRGDQFDAVMNYEFAKPAQRFFVNQKKAITPKELDRELHRALSWYAPQVNLVLQNLFCSHDTDRVASMLLNPDLEYDGANRLQDNGPNYNAARPTADCWRKLKLMTAFQMSYLGAPMIYYGDECGMYGADDPTCRKPMIWKELLPYDDPDEQLLPDLLEHTRRWIAIRNSLPALQLGSFETLLADDRHGAFAFARTLNGQSIVVVANNTDHAYVCDVPVPWPDSPAVVRLDDPQTCDVVAPSEGQPAGRPALRLRSAGGEGLRIEKGRLRGATLEPRSAGAFAELDKQGNIRGG